MFSEGSTVFIRTVTYHYVGRITRVSDGLIYLDDASWVADSGRFSVFLVDGQPAESERYPNGCAVAIASIVDVSPWNHQLPATSI